MDYREKVTISIGLPTYNRAALLPRAIESILAQTFPHFELIIVDDGSTDSTREIFAAYSDARIRIIYNGENRGLMSSRNIAIRASRGDYLAFQDSDDWWHPRKLEEEVALLKGVPSRVGAVYSRIEKQYVNGRKEFLPPDGYESLNGNLLEAFLNGGYLITLQAVLMRKSCIEVIGMFDEDFSVFGDAEFIIRLASHYEFLYNPFVRAHLEVQRDSISRNKKGRVDSRELIFLKHQKLFEQHPHKLKHWALMLARSYARQRRWRKALRYIGIYSKATL